MFRGLPPRASLKLCAIAVWLLAAGAGFRAAAPEQTRALWVTRTTLTSPEAIREMVTAAQAGGFNTLLVQVRGRGDAYYSGTLEPRAPELAGKPAFDPLATVLEQAHGAGMKKIDLRSPAYVGRLARWTRAHSGIVEGLYTSPLHPAAQDHTAAVIGEIAAKYNVDGIHLDYVRFPNDDFDYSPAAIEQFKSAILPGLSDREKREAAAQAVLDPAAYPNLFPERWSDFRRSRLTSLVVKIRTAVKAVRPNAVLSAAVVPDAQVAFDNRLQDWRGWIDQSLIDVVCPMAYTTEAATFQRQIAAARGYAGSHPVWAGIGAYQLSASQTLQHIAAANKLGVAGIILFSYDALTAPPNGAASVSELGRAAFGVGSAREY